MTDTAALVARFTEAANTARMSEEAYRREASLRIDALARERAHAFRRLNLVRTILAALEPEAEPELQVARARAAVRGALGWEEADERRNAILDRLEPAIRVLAGLPLTVNEEAPPSADDAAQPLEADAPQPGPSAAELLVAFETWFEAETGNSFYVLFERYVPETPVVDF